MRKRNARRLSPVRKPASVWKLKAVHLGHVKYLVATGKAGRVSSSFLFACFLSSGVWKLPEDHECGVFALPDLCAELLPLLIRCPDARLVPFSCAVAQGSARSRLDTAAL